MDRVDTVGGVSPDRGRMEAYWQTKASSGAGKEHFRVAHVPPNKLRLTFAVRAKHQALFGLSSKMLSLRS